MIGDPEDHPTEPNEKNIDAPNEIPVEQPEPDEDDDEADQPEEADEADPK